MALDEPARKLGVLLTDSTTWPGGEAVDLKDAPLKGKGAFATLIQYAGATVVCPLSQSLSLPPLGAARASYIAAAGLSQSPFLAQQLPRGHKSDDNAESLGWGCGDVADQE